MVKKLSIPVTISTVFCGCIFVGALGLLALSSYHLSNDKDSGNVPTEQSDEWITHVIALIPTCVTFMLLSVFSLWTILVKDRRNCFIAVLVLNFLCVVASVYFSVVFANELDAAPASGELLFNRTKSAIANKTKNHKLHWLPSWLDSIQKRSKECCGINTFRDWEQFWPEQSTEVPRSCCRNSEDNASFCPTDLAIIPFPGTPSMFIKTDTGCLDEINDLTKKNILECFVYIVLMCCIFVVAEIAYLVQFYKQYVPRSGGLRDRYGASKGDKFFDENGGPQGDDDGKVPDITSTDSYLQISGFTASLQTTSSTGSVQNSMGIDPDTGNKNPIALSANTSNSGFGGRQQSLARMQQQQQQQQDGIPVVAIVSSASSIDQATGKKKKSKKHRLIKSNNDATATDNDQVKDLATTASRQEVNLAPGIMDDDYLVNVQDPTFGSQASPTASLDDVGDQLAETAQPVAPANHKKKFGLGALTRRFNH